MKKALRWIGYILGILIAILVIVFGALYIRYLTQSTAIHQAVDGFIAETHIGTDESLRPYVASAFFGQLTDLLNSQGEIFTHVARVDENEWYFDYSWKFGVGETTAYHGTVTFDTGETGDYDLKLIKEYGHWVVYGVNIQPHSKENPGDH